MNEILTIVLIILNTQLCVILSGVIVIGIKFALGNKMDSIKTVNPIPYDFSNMCDAFGNIHIEKKEEADVKEEPNMADKLNDEIDNNNKRLNDLNCTLNSLMKKKYPKNVKQMSDLVLKTSQMLKEQHTRQNCGKQD